VERGAEFKGAHVKTAMLESERIIRAQIGLIILSHQFKKWIEALKTKNDGYVVFNNSFLFRENPKANKGRYYLGVAFRPSGGGLKPDDISILQGVNQNSDYQFLQQDSSSISQVSELSKEIKRSVKSFGRVGFVLIGGITDDVTISKEMQSSQYSKLTVNPKQREILLIKEKEVSIRELVDEEELWHELQSQYQLRESTSDNLPDELAAPLAKALNELRQQAYVRLNIPEDASTIGQTMLDDIIAAFESATTEYKKSLEQCAGDYRKNPEQFNNVLRIAYNFSSDALAFLKVITHMSDLKPIVLFTTIHAQFALNNAFKELPWPRSRQKGSLTLYDNTVKGARNHAFHRLFPFSKSIEVDVAGLSFKATKLRLFSEYATRTKKKDNVDFEDRELIELLTEFSRTTEHTVTPVFWQKNLIVMENTVSLLKQLKKALTGILSDQHNIKP
jgi:hypothetical protein